MKESYEPIKMDIREIPEEDVITVSEFDDGPHVYSIHDNSYIDWSSLQ